MIDLVLLKVGSPEFQWMWNEVANHPVNEGIEFPTISFNPEIDACWIYKYSIRRDNEVLHELIHMRHPITEDKYNLIINASPHFNEGDIEKVISVK